MLSEKLSATCSSLPYSLLRELPSFIHHPLVQFYGFFLFSVAIVSFLKKTGPEAKKIVFCPLVTVNSSPKAHGSWQSFHRLNTRSD